MPGAILDNVPPGLGGEDFGGSMRQGKDGKVYIQAGKTGLWNVEVTGLDTIQEIPGGKVTMGADDVKTAQTFREKQLQAAEGNKKYAVRKATVAFTGNLDADFKGFEEAEKPAFERQSGSRVRVAMARDEANLYVGWEVQDDTPWVNGADAPEFMYARGDTVDLQLGTDPAADTKRDEPVKGDLRLSIGNFQGKPTAVVYRKVADEKKPKTFSSGVVKEYVMDSVVVLDDAKMTVKVDAQASATWSKPRSRWPSLGLKLTDGLALRGDFGATHGDKSGNGHDAAHPLEQPDHRHRQRRGLRAADGTGELGRDHLPVSRASDLLDVRDVFGIPKLTNPEYPKETCYEDRFQPPYRLRPACDVRICGHANRELRHSRLTGAGQGRHRRQIRRLGPHRWHLCLQQRGGAA